MSHAAEINDDGLNTVAFALNLGLQLLHLVTVKGIRDILASNQHRQILVLPKAGLTRRMLIVAMVAIIVVYVQRRSEMVRSRKKEMSARMDIHKDMRESRMMGGFLRRCRKAL